MSAEVSARLALAVYVIGVAVTFGLRTWQHRRATGRSGFQGVSGRPGSAGWWGGVLFVMALVLSAAGIGLAALGLGPPPRGAPGLLAWVGLVLASAGFVVVVLAQSGMGSSWRIGVDEKERTALVTEGLFRHARNPIFTGMCAAVGGLALMAPTLATAAAFAALVTAVQLQVRAVEEPYLLAVHGAEYLRYATQVGRFIPGVGQLPTPRTTRTGER